MPTPVLLLSPDLARDASGSVSLSVNGATSVVAGTYGDAWSCPADADTVTLADGVTYITDSAVTILMRVTYTGISVNRYPVKLPTENGYALGRLATRQERFYVRAASAAGGTLADNTQAVQAGRYRNGVATVYRNGVATGTADRPAPLFANNVLTIGGGECVVESVLIYREGLSNDAIAYLSALDEAWTWENTTVPEPEPLVPVLTIGDPYVGPLRIGKD